MNATCRLVTPAPAGRGAIAAIEVRGDVDSALAALAIAPVAVGRVALRSLAGVDQGVVARWKVDQASLMPHAGPAVVRALLAAMRGAGLRLEEGSPPVPVVDLAGIETAMEETLARAASPLAVDQLLSQPDRWRAWLGAGGRWDDPTLDAHAKFMNRLVVPPVVAVVGRSNIGKSTLLNALAGRLVAAAADELGTTRDHVGVAIDCAGLVVHWVDTPGQRQDADAVERLAAELTRPLIAAADLVVSCCDHASPLLEDVPAAAERVIRLALRADLGAPRDRVELAVAAGGGAPGGLGELVSAVRERLLPEGVLGSALPWRFW